MDPMDYGGFQNQQLPMNILNNWDETYKMEVWKKDLSF